MSLIKTYKNKSKYFSLLKKVWANIISYMYMAHELKKSWNAM